jgi:hypothetical protein
MDSKDPAAGAPGAAAAEAMEVDAAAPGAATHAQQPDKVIVHPLVLLSVVDHYNREAKVTARCAPVPAARLTYAGRAAAGNEQARGGRAAGYVVGQDARHHQHLRRSARAACVPHPTPP